MSQKIKDIIDFFVALFEFLRHSVGIHWWCFAEECIYVSENRTFSRYLHTRYHSDLDDVIKELMSRECKFCRIEFYGNTL